MNTILNLIKVATVGVTIILAAESSLAKKGAFKSDVDAFKANYKPLVEQLEKAKFTGAIVIARQNEDSFFAGFGGKATVTGKPDSMTLVDIGSISKTVTAVAVLRLLDQGTVSYTHLTLPTTPYV